MARIRKISRCIKFRAVCNADQNSRGLVRSTKQAGNPKYAPNA
ncbi:hypothetical protein RBSH_05210 [Rhodopirellula baltica SH28]|uniref:Uncharacterized protein n=1 Tax=Rhodopirellula baltica SH28 TaxID=993517 RepID=K5E125_RHOBT|nr:hypothetical protein RBSH_05210 [Rhodopirellula baltica SH28]